MLRCLPTLLIMVIRWPTSVPFTSKDRVTYQINGEITMSKERGNEHERLLSRLNAPKYFLNFKNKTSLLFSKNKHLHFQNIFQTWKHFQKINIFVYILTNENHYKVFLNNGIFTKYFQKPHKAKFQTKASDLASN